MRLLDTIGYQLRLRKLKRNEYESAELRAWFARDFGVEVGLYSYGCFDRWRFPARTRIGRYCSFAKSVRVVDLNHPVDALTTHPYLYDPSLGLPVAAPAPPAWLEISDDVWVSHNVTILPGCKQIGRGAILGAGAVVTKDVAPYSIVFGVPARPVRMRFPPDLIAAIEASRWWELDKAELAELVRTNPDLVYHPTAERLTAFESSGMKGST